ncbi:MAG TPA: hypothetical protein VFV83_03360, partial [Chthoniobacteraceae bacterium]|nr:hypothetical protein [Chthoniobacteraceae bacterium]
MVRDLTLTSLAPVRSNGDGQPDEQCAGNGGRRRESDFVAPDEPAEPVELAGRSRQNRFIREMPLDVHR